MFRVIFFFFFCLSVWCSYKQILEKCISLFFLLCGRMGILCLSPQNEHARTAPLFLEEARHNFMYYIKKKLSFFVWPMWCSKSKSFHFLQWLSKKKIHNKKKNVFRIEVWNANYLCGVWESAQSPLLSVLHDNYV